MEDYDKTMEAYVCDGCHDIVHAPMTPPLKGYVTINIVTCPDCGHVQTVVWRYDPEQTEYGPPAPIDAGVTPDMHGLYTKIADMLAGATRPVTADEIATVARATGEADMAAVLKILNHMRLDGRLERTVTWHRVGGP